MTEFPVTKKVREIFLANDGAIDNPLLEEALQSLFHIVIKSEPTDLSQVNTEEGSLNLRKLYPSLPEKAEVQTVRDVETHRLVSAFITLI